MENLRKGEVKILRFLARQGPANSSRIFPHINPGTVSSYLIGDSQDQDGPLVERGYVCRTPGKDPRTKGIYHITAKGLLALMLYDDMKLKIPETVNMTVLEEAASEMGEESIDHLLVHLCATNLRLRYMNLQLSEQTDILVHSDTLLRKQTDHPILSLEPVLQYLLTPMKPTTKEPQQDNLERQRAAFYGLMRIAELGVSVSMLLYEVGHRVFRIDIMESILRAWEITDSQAEIFWREALASSYWEETVLDLDATQEAIRDHLGNQ